MEIRNKLVTAVAVIIAFTALLLGVYLVLIKLFRVDVVFYSSLHAAGIATLILGVLLFRLPAARILSPFERMQTLAMCAMIGYIFAISAPTVIDRSLSFYILEKLQQRGGAIREDRFHYIFTQEYMREHRLVDVRLTEQAVSGTIVIEDGCVLLTPRGDRLARFSRFFRQHLLPKQRLLAGEYTDELTDPFRRSDSAPDYLCEQGSANIAE